MIDGGTTTTRQRRRLRRRLCLGGRPSDDDGFIETAVAVASPRACSPPDVRAPGGHHISPRAEPGSAGLTRPPEGRDAASVRPSVRPSHYRRPDDDGGCDRRTEDRHSCPASRPATRLMNGGTERLAVDTPPPPCPAQCPPGHAATAARNPITRTRRRRNRHFRGGGGGGG